MSRSQFIADQFGNGNENVPFLRKPVDGQAERVVTVTVDLMHQDDASVLCFSHNPVHGLLDVLRPQLFGIGALVLPVLRIDRPENDRIADRSYLFIREIASGRSEKSRLNARNLFDLRRCHLTGIDGDELFTESASLITGAAARIVKQPENVTAANGGKAVLHVEAENAISYQWQYDDGISGWWDLVERDDRVGTMTDTLTLSVRPSVTEF